MNQEKAADLHSRSALSAVAALSSAPKSPVGTPALQKIAVVSRVGGGELREKDEGDAKSKLAVTAGWGHAGKGGITMLGKGKLIERDYTAAEARRRRGEARRLRAEAESQWQAAKRWFEEQLLGPIDAWFPRLPSGNGDPQERLPTSR
jgi:hypothetical protein